MLSMSIHINSHKEMAVNVYGFLKLISSQSVCCSLICSSLSIHTAKNFGALLKSLSTVKKIQTKHDEQIKRVSNCEVTVCTP